MEITVVVVDDFPLVRDGIAAALEVDPAIRVVGEASTASEAVACVRELHPDVVTLDLRLPDSEGTALIERLRREAEVRVLVVTAIEKLNTPQSVAEAGAAGYVTKRVAARDLRNAVITVHGGGTVFDTSATADLMHGYPQISSGEPAAVKRLLTIREQQVLALVTRGYRDREIAAELSLSTRTVQNHLTSIRAKTGLRRRSELASWAIRHAS